MYRVVKKTTKTTAYKCLDCKHCKIIDKNPVGGGTIIECIAENKCFLKEFNARDYYCIQYKGFNDMNDKEKEKVKDKILKDYSEKEFKKYARTYYTKKEADLMIKKRRDAR